MTSITREALITGANVRVKRTRHGFVLYNLHDAYVGRSIELYGEFSEEETKLFARIVKPGMTVVDIGANIGAHTLFFAAAVGPTGAVIAFEPQRVLYQMLCANLALNEITNVRPLQMGAGRESGQAFIPGIDYAKPGNFGGIALGRQGIGEEVMVAPIDQIGLEQCHFMKIDVEGMEEEAILGAKETIARHRPILYVENDRRERSPSLIRRLLEMNYLLRWHLPPLFSAENAYRNPQNVFPNIVSVNMLCVPREAGPTVADSGEIVDPDAWPLDPAPARPITPGPLGRQPKPPAGKTLAPTPDVGRALKLEQAGRLDEAAQLYAAVLKTDRQDPHALHRRAVLCSQSGDHAQALTLIETAVQVTPAAGPAYAQLLSDYGLVLHNLQRFDDAVAAFDQALLVSPNLSAALSNRGNTLLALKRDSEALASYDQALAITPKHADVLNNRGTALKRLGRIADALASFTRAIAARSDFVAALYNRGIALLDLDRPQEALASLDAALAVEPHHPEVLCRRGDALVRLDRFTEAIGAYEAVLQMMPNSPEFVPLYRGDALRHLGRLDLALASAAKLLAINPEHAGAHSEHGLAALTLGDFATGWASYERRWSTVEFVPRRRDFSQPLWLGGESIAGRTILLHAEQGFGDTIQFVRYAPLVAQLGATIVLEVQADLVPLLTGMRKIASIVARGDALPAFDLHCPLMSLPLAFGTRIDTIPATCPYLSAPEPLVAAWRSRLPAARPLVGLVWSGLPSHNNDRNRSIALARLLPLLGAKGVQFVSLQRDIRAADAAVLRDQAGVLGVGRELATFADTAAVISALDLVISVDTSVAHLAGALAKPVFVLLPVGPDFRWLLDRCDSPWYPSARLFRQPRPDDWESVVARVRGELEQLVPAS